MTINVSNVDVTVDTFSVMVSRVNQLADAMSNHTVTLDTSASGNSSSGNGFISGIFGANTIAVGTNIRGGSVNQSANLNVTSNTVFESNVVFGDVVTFNSAISLANGISVNSAANFSNTISITGNATLSNSVIILGNTTLSNTLSVTGNSIFANTLSVIGNVNLSNTLSIIGNTSLSNTLTVAGNTNLSNTLTITGNATFSNTLTVTGNVIFANTLTVAGNVNVNNSLMVGYGNVITINSASFNIYPISQIATVGANASLLIMRYSNNASSPRLLLAKSRNDSPGLSGNVANKDYLGRVSFAGDNNTYIIESAIIAGRVLGTVTANAVPTGIVFETSETNNNPVERFVIDPAGNVGIGSFTATTLPNAKLQVQGTANVSGNTTFGENVTIVGNTRNTGNLIVTGNVNLSNTMTITGNVTLANTLTITGNVNLSNTLTVTGNATFSNTVTVNNLTVTGNTNIDTGTLFIDSTNDRIGIGNTSPDARLTVTGAANVSGNVAIGGDLNVTGNTVFDDKVTFLTDIEMYNGRVISPVLIQTLDSNAALKITQSGTGHALYVEDSTSPDPTPTVITNNGVFIGGSNSHLTIGSTAKIQAISTDAGTHYLAAGYANISNQGARITFYKSRSVNTELYSAVANGDQIGRLDFFADDGGQPIEAARIMVLNNGTPGPNSMPTAIHFYSTNEGSNSALAVGPKLSIMANGNVGVGIGTPTEKLYVNGTLRSIGNVTFSAQLTVTGNTTIDSGTFTLDSVLNTVGIGAATPNTRLSVSGPLALYPPTKVNTVAYAVTVNDSSLIIDTVANCNVIMPTAATYPGRILYIKNIAARSVNSTSANIKPIDSNTSANSILTNTSGKFAMLQSDGADWVIMMSN